MEEDEKLYNNEEKLNFIIKYLKLDVGEIEKNFGYASGYVSKLRGNHYGKLRPIHFYAFESAYNIPLQIFQDEKIDTTHKIINILKQKSKKDKNIFKRDESVLEGLLGEWYAYVYAGSPFAPIYCIKTTIYSDYTISDENGNYGQILIGELQSVFIKKAVNSRNFVSILFDNADIRFELFHFSMLSKRNQVKREMCNFGFFSRKKIDSEFAKKILGRKEDVQLKMSCDFKERVAEYAELIEED